MAKPAEMQEAVFLNTKNCLDENINSAKAENACPKHVKITLVYILCKIHNSNWCKVQSLSLAFGVT